MPDEPDLTAELDEAEAIAAGDVTFTFPHGTKVTVNRDGNVVETEWGLRQPSGIVVRIGGDEDAGRTARMLAADHAASGNPGALRRRTVTYSPWEVVADEH